jgi:hypothetical protein
VLAGGELTTDSDVTIGGGTSVVIDADQASRVLAVQGFGSRVVLDHLTITGGEAEGGAGIQGPGATFPTLTDSTVTGNTSTGGDGANNIISGDQGGTERHGGHLGLGVRGDRETRLADRSTRRPTGDGCKRGLGGITEFSLAAQHSSKRSQV